MGEGRGGGGGEGGAAGGVGGGGGHVPNFLAFTDHKFA